MYSVANLVVIRSLKYQQTENLKRQKVIDKLIVSEVQSDCQRLIVT